MDEISKYDVFDLFRQLGIHSGSAEAALAAIYEAFKTALASYIKRYIRDDEALIKDVIAETMLVLWTKREEAAQKEKPLPWLLTIAHHIAIDKIRAQKKYYTEPLEDNHSLSGDDHTARETERKELEELLRKAAYQQLRDPRGSTWHTGIDPFAGNHICGHHKRSVHRSAYTGSQAAYH